jgi:uncharacterized C2H2 Zn-finger protein
MSRKRKKGKPRANSKKKRKHSHEADDEEGSTVEAQPQDERTRLAEEILLRERRRRIREEEPEMFDEYAMSEESRRGSDAVEDDVLMTVSQSDGHQEANAGEEEYVNVNGAEVDAEDDEEDNAMEVTGEEDGADVADEDVEGSNQDEPPDSDQQDAHMSELPDAIEAGDGDADVIANEANLGTTKGPVTSHYEITEQVQEGKVDEAPVAKPRKRKLRQSESSSAQPNQAMSKRRKKTQIPTPDDRDDSNVADVSAAEATSHPQSRKSGRRQSNMEEYTQPLARGSELRHPVYNPESPVTGRANHSIEVVVPMSSAGPSNVRISTGQSASPARSASGLKRRPKGSLSPLKTVRQDQWDIRSQNEPQLQNGFAKSTARRTFQDADDASDDDYQSAEDMLSEVASRSRKDKTSKKGKEPVNRSSSPSTKVMRKRKPHQFRCPICNATYASEKSLEKHRNDPTAHEHLLDCQRCDEQFATKAALARHQKEQGHGSNNRQLKSTQRRKTGHFTTDEKNRLDLWRETFCDEHDLNHYEFNEMMTASGKIGTSSWPYKFISKSDFQLEYYDVLPDRDLRSMRRYRSNYSNVDRSRDFTEQDDEDILILVAQMGQKWTDLGDQLSRDPEALRQRWKNKLQFDVRGEELKKGNWEEDERKRFDDAVKEIRRSTLSQGIEDVDSFNWTAVSLKVKTRTAPQCANHWRAMHGKMVKGLWVDSGVAQIMKPKKKSKMEVRLAEKKPKSKSRITASDDEASGEDAAVTGEADAEDGSEPGDLHESATPADIEAAEADGTDAGAVKATPSQRRKPNIVQNRTPANGLSATQAFEQTQAHTSEVKRTAKRRRKSDPSQDQPSPGIAVQVRPERSPEFGQRLEEVLEDVKSDVGPSNDESGHSSADEGELEVDNDHDEQQQLSAADEDDNNDETESALVGDEAQVASEEGETRSQLEQEDDADDEKVLDSTELPNGNFKAVNGHANLPTSRDERDSDADSIVQIFKTAASPFKKKYGARQKQQGTKGHAQKAARRFRWPEEDVHSQSEAESETSGLGVENLPR